MKPGSSSFKLWLAFATLVVLNFFDALTTGILVNHFGTTDIEANPIVRYAMDLYGVFGMYLFKALMLGFMALIVSIVIRKYLEHRAAMMAHRSMWFVNAVFLFVVVNNALLVNLAINT